MYLSYVHRLIQNRSDGKLVELPAASSLTTRGGDDSDDGPGPSSNDEKKISKIEDITLEYSYLLTSQLEQQRKYFEGEIAKGQSELVELKVKLQEEGINRTAEKEAQEKAVLQSKVIPGLEFAKAKAEKRAETVSGPCAVSPPSPPAAHRTSCFSPGYSTRSQIAGRPRGREIHDSGTCDPRQGFDRTGRSSKDRVQRAPRGSQRSQRDGFGFDG